MSGQKGSGPKVFAGIDVGSATTKVVLINDRKEVLADDVRRSGIDFNETSKNSLDAAMKKAGVDKGAIAYTVSTGYGRRNAEFANDTKTEISCHAKGAYHYFPKMLTIIDIGGQDNKIIKLDSEGKITSFKMNRKCAAGTGTFLEEIAFKIGIGMGEMETTALRSSKPTKLNSFCTVFASTEIIEKIRAGEKKEDMLRGVYASVVERVTEMDSLSGDIVLTGGVVEHNKLIVDLFEKKLGCKILLPPRPQLMGAFGAALFARERAI